MEQMHGRRPPVVLLTGSPGVGKTTAIRRFIGMLRQRSAGSSARRVELRGFLTREIRGARGREGFEAVLLTGEGDLQEGHHDDGGHGGEEGGTGVIERTVLLAHESKIRNAGGRLPQVSKYVVDVPSFETAVLPELNTPEKKDTQGAAIVYVIDEIGKMECFSSAFKRKVSHLLDYHSQHADVYVVGTIALKSQDRFIEGIKARKDVCLIEVTPENRTGVPSHMMELLFGHAA